MFHVWLVELTYFLLHFRKNDAASVTRILEAHAEEQRSCGQLIQNYWIQNYWIS